MSRAIALAQQKVEKPNRLAAAAFLLFAFTLSPRLDSGTYGIILTSGSLIYILPGLLRSSGDLFPPEFLAFVGLVGLYVLLSIGHVFPTEGFLFNRFYVTHQASGLLIFAATYPAFVKASRSLLFAREAALDITIVAIISFVVGITLRPGENMILDGQLYGSMSPVMLVQFSFFIVVVALVRGRLSRALLLLLAVPFMGAATNLLIQLALAITCMFKGNRTIPLAIFGSLLIFVLLMAFPPHFIDEIIRADSNSHVRAQMWHEALPIIVSHPLGIGFGTSYTDLQAMRDPIILHTYSGNLERSFEIANHNSFIDTALRMGIMGLILLMFLFWKSWSKLRGDENLLIGSAVLCICLIASGLSPTFEGGRAILFMTLGTAYLRAALCWEMQRARNGGAQANASPSQPARGSPGEHRRTLAAITLSRP